MRSFGPSFPEFPSSIERVALTKGGAELLGSPVWGSEQFFQDCFSKCIEKIWQCQQELQSLENPQTELHLLRSWLSLCKINHLLRTVPPDKVPTQLQLFDHNLHRSLEGIVNCSISESSWLQATGYTSNPTGWIRIKRSLQKFPCSILPAVTIVVS